MNYMVVAQSLAWPDTPKLRPTNRPRNAHRSKRTNIKIVRASNFDDPGDWELSPEWMGSQGGAWGRGDGHIIFCSESNHGNGKVGACDFVMLS
eukprot:jgi/Botrbrau1/18617/Bobra.0367s0056.1